MKLRVLNKFGASEQLASPDEIEVIFPHENDSTIVKRFSTGAVKILNDIRGEIEVELSSFDTQGMKLGEKQNFVVRIFSDGKTREAIFARCLNVRMIDDRKVICR